MPLQSYTTVHAFTTSSPKMEDFVVAGKIFPLPQSGLLWLEVALVLLLGVGIFQRRVPASLQKILLWLGVLAAYWGTLVLSCRWLDDVFINLIHPYNLFHHGLFSTRMDSMNNGTVEILYYALLTPFAANKITLIRAEYAVGALLGVGHLVALHHLLRRVALIPRFYLLALFAAWVPIIQVFSSGYGNGVVTLFWLLGVIAVIENKQRHLALFCFLMPLFRPDALLYSFSLAGLYGLIHRRFILRWWIPTLLAPVLYALLVHQLYGQWVPTPVIFKRISMLDILSGFPLALAEIVSTYLFSSPERLLLLFFGAIFFLLPAKNNHSLTPRIVRALLISTLPVLVFFYTTGKFGYNPTNYRYFLVFDIALFLAGTMGIVSLLERLPRFTEDSAPETVSSEMARFSSVAYFLPVVLVFFLHANIARSILVVEQKDWTGRDIGIESTYYDVKRMTDLRFGGEYFGKIVPAGWEIASTEMDTFGYFSGREILDLWGFSNRQIAHSSDQTSNGVRRDTTCFLNSNVPLFWVRTMSKNDDQYVLHDKLESNDPHVFDNGLRAFPNLSPEMEQAGPLDTTLQKYDVVRILHGKSEISLLLVRKDLADTFTDALVRGGAKPAGTFRLPLTP